VSTPFLLSGDLLLENISNQSFLDIENYKAITVVDLTQINKIDSAGIAYLVQIKIHYPALLLINASAKLLILAELYGVEKFFEK